MTEYFDSSDMLNGLESNEMYLEKINYDTKAKCGGYTPRRNGMMLKNNVRDPSRIRKRNYKKKLYRRFLTMNPAMDIDNLKTNGMSCREAIYFNFPKYTGNGFYDPHLEYCLNPYEKLFISRRGDLRKYHGNISCKPGYRLFTLANKDAFVSRLTNRRIRRERIGEDSCPASYSYCKKLYGPIVNDLW